MVRNFFLVNLQRTNKIYNVINVLLRSHRKKHRARSNYMQLTYWMGDFQSSPCAVHCLTASRLFLHKAPILIKNTRRKHIYKYHSSVVANVYCVNRFGNLWLSKCSTLMLFDDVSCYFELMNDWKYARYYIQTRTSITWLGFF